MPKIAQYVEEVLVQNGSVYAIVDQSAIEVLITSPTPSPTTVSGAGVSQYLVEVLYCQSSPLVKVTNDIIEVLLAPEDSYSGTRPNTQVWVSVF